MWALSKNGRVLATIHYSPDSNIQEQINEIPGLRLGPDAKSKVGNSFFSEESLKKRFNTADF